MLYNTPLLIITLALCDPSWAQEEPMSTLNIGDPAPPLRVSAWLKGEPITEFQKGKVYVLGFWATWCAPCKAAMPQLSALAQKYKDDITVIGIDIYEEGKITVQRLQRFVDSMGNKMDYHVAAEDSNYMATDWVMAAGREQGIPRTIVVDKAGQVAWIGHPKDLDDPLNLIVSDRWDIASARQERDTRRYIDSLDSDSYHDFREFYTNTENSTLKNPNGLLARVREMVTKETRLKYTYFVAVHTLSALLDTDQLAAYEYAEAGMDSAWSKESFYDAVVNAVTYYTGEPALKPAFYKLAAEALQIQIDLQPYPELISRHKYYSKLADWHSRANNKSAAVKAMEKAVDALKQKPGASKEELNKLNITLQQYKAL